ncbi:MAG: FGGY-family carbohydrate kinase [Thermomicrobiales bacterium]
MLYDVHRKCWSDEHLAAFSIDRKQLPDIADATAIAGEITPHGADLSGLLPGTRVIVGTGDDFSGAVGAGIVAPGRISCSIGTAEVVGAISDTAILDEGDLIETHGFPGGRYFLENPGWLGGGAVSWFCSTFGITSAADMSALAGNAATGSDDLLFLPALSGAMAPRWVSSARGAFYGLTAGHGRAECARAVLEGCAFAMRDESTRLTEMLGPSPEIRLSGGGSQSDIWASIRADVSEMPIEVVTNPDSAPLGAAVFALMSIPGAPSIEELAAKINPVARVVEPNPETTSRYNDCYARYRKLFDSLSPMFEEE